MTAKKLFSFFTVFLFGVFFLFPGCSGDASGDNRDDADSFQMADDDTGEAGPDDDSSPWDDDDFDDDTELPPEGTRYPIVLLHGFFGWGYLDNAAYFFNVVDLLEENGFEVFEPAVSPVNSMEERADELVVKIEEKYPGQKINVVSHSQGGLDARYMISALGWGDRIASLMTVSGPHRGTSLADIACGLIPGFAQDIIDLIIGFFGMDWDGIYQLSHEYMEGVFNPENSDDPRVTYYSFQADAEEIFALLVPTHLVMNAIEGCNDGIIGCESAKWGQEMGMLPTDHWGIIGQPLGLIEFDHLQFYLDWANFLRDEGF